MANNDITQQVILDSIGIKAFIMPQGYFSDVEIHCWGAGGGSGNGGKGGGGGYAKTIATINPGDEVVLQIGQPGGSSTGVTVGTLGGRGGSDPSYRILRGGNAGTTTQYDEGYNGAGGGGGGASWVVVENNMICCGGGGGGGGGGLSYQLGLPGLPGGSFTALFADSRGGDSVAGYATGGGGGGGYPKGGQGGITVPDDAGRGGAGNGGQNYGNVTVVGSGTLPGSTTISYYPGKKKGEAGYPGYIIMILRKKFNAFIKNPDSSGNWVRTDAAYTKVPPFFVPKTLVFQPQTISYSASGVTTFTVPAKITSITITVTGGGGGGGGADGDAAGGYPGGGYPGSRITATIPVTPGQTYIIQPGEGGAGGAGRASSGAGGAGGSGYYSGGRGGYSGGSGSSGAGGGGGGATVVRLGATLVAVAGGGAGAGGSGNGNYGIGSIGTFSSTTAGAQGQDKGGDGGGGGGGGGGYPLGGAGGPTRGGDAGAYSGTTGQSLVPPGGALGAAANGGGYISGNGGRGSVVITYTQPTENILVQTGGWKQIQQVYTKVASEWRPILESDSILLNSYPVKRRAAVINITVPTDDFVVYNVLPIQYFEGLMDVTVNVSANVVVKGSATSDAFTVNRFLVGDTVTINNLGTIQGRGGNGGTGGNENNYWYGYYGRWWWGWGYYSTPGAAGAAGGAGLVSDFPVTVTNSGTIAGGGGGGGGGGSGHYGYNYWNYGFGWGWGYYGSYRNSIQGGGGGGGAGFGSGAAYQGGNGTLTAGGAGGTPAYGLYNGWGTGGAGGGRGAAGTAGTAGNSYYYTGWSYYGWNGNQYTLGGAGGSAGYALKGQSNITFVGGTGTVIGPIS